MSIASAERSFSKGLAALADAQPLQAADCFLDAMQIERLLQVRRPDMRYLSYYGLSLARASRVWPAATQACELAVQEDPSNAALHLNLGRVHLLAGHLPRALQCFERGLRIAPAHRSLRLELSRHDRRSRTCLPLLHRSHALNRWVGKLRASIRARLGTPPRARETG